MTCLLTPFEIVLNYSQTHYVAGEDGLELDLLLLPQKSWYYSAALLCLSLLQ